MTAIGTIRLCLNCLHSADDVRAVPVGPDKGGQRDSFRDTVDLCEQCRAALLRGDFYCLHARYKQQVLITRNMEGGTA